MALQLRYSPIGVLLRAISNRRLLLYPEEQPDFKLHLSRYGDFGNSCNTAISTINTVQPHPIADKSPGNQDDLSTGHRNTTVGWYAPDDPENPRNWTNRSRVLITLIICLYTFAIYTSSAIYISAIEDVIVEFDVTHVEASLGLALFVLGYGVGPLLFSPLSEIPRIGRSPIYTLTMALYVVVSVPTALTKSWAGFLTCRFFQGFFGSPCLASGAATLDDIYGPKGLPFALTTWTSASFVAPAIGPLLSGFAVPVMGWRWSMWEILLLSGPTLLPMLLLPETSGPTIIHHRAQRLRRLTGRSDLQSLDEIESRKLTASHVLKEALVKPLEITVKDPAVLFVQVYTAINYGIYYSFFEVFPIVYTNLYRMTTGEVGIVFLCILVACILGAGFYFIFLKFYMIPRMRLSKSVVEQETRLLPTLAASFGPTVGLFVFAWTSSPRIHWIVPTIGITIYSGSAFIILQCVFAYIPLSYPRFSASLFAANDFFRGTFAFASILYARPLFENLGIARGCSLLGGLSTIGIVGSWTLNYWGAALRARSKFADS
ncbi:Transporter mfs1 [Colletotrichum gloeosporioides]|uniref:Transporter mfs1 n=1 Tax=Colletotrichum gloeosporioides TaxID=474922 RepID=A0A8H4CR11_COLGL|nr:Transporter mfs1 [Colletotrichum gloeosporioides]KAF3808242.1 Transporter mfs1 [Colletotrichum gloeosporioides]